MSASAKASQTSQARKTNTPARLTLRRRRTFKPGWLLPMVVLLALVWLLGAAAAPQTALQAGVVGLGALLAYLGLGFCGTRATVTRQGGALLVAWAAAADQLHRAFLPPHSCGIVPWLLAFGAGMAGSWLAAERVRASYRAATPAENLAFQMDFGEEAGEKRRSA